MVLRKAAAAARVRRSSGAKGSVLRATPDRSPGIAATHANAVLARMVDHNELRATLDGDCERTACGFHCSTDERVLFVPHTKAADAACAILLCRQGGIVREKLAAMDDITAAFVYATTLACCEPDNN